MRTMSLPLGQVMFRLNSSKLIGSSGKARRNERRAPSRERSKKPAKAASKRASRSRPRKAISNSAKLIMRKGALRSGGLADPIDDMVFQIAGLSLGDHAAPHRDARLMHGPGIAGDQGMPPCQVLALSQQPIGAGLGQPIEAPDIARRQLYAIRHQLLTVLIILAAAVPEIELAAGDIGEVQLAGIRVPQLLQAAAAAAVAQTLPLLLGHLTERDGLPERLLGILRHRQNLFPS